MYQAHACQHLANCPDCAIGAIEIHQVGDRAGGGHLEDRAQAVVAADETGSMKVPVAALDQLGIRRLRRTHNACTNSKTGVARA